MGLGRTDTDVLQSLRDGLVQARGRSDEAFRLAEAEVSKTLNQVQEDIRYWEQVLSRCQDQSCRDTAQSKLQFLREYVRRVEADAKKFKSSEIAFVLCIDASIQILTEQVAVLERYLQLNGARTLLNQEIDAHLVTRLINNKADLGDIAINVQFLFDGGIRIDLVNGWLDNRTHLNDAIAIMNQGVDLNLIGTSRKVGNFAGLAGTTPNEVVARIPVDAEIEEWTPLARHAQEGMKFKWKDASGRTRRVRMHDPDPSAPAGSNAASGWVLRVQSGKKCMDADGDFIKPSSSDYTEEKANETHIPIQSPPSTKSAS